MIEDVWRAIITYWYVVIMAFVVTVAFEKLHPLFKVVFWSATVGGVLYIVLRVGLGGLVQLISSFDEMLAEME